MYLFLAHVHNQPKMKMISSRAQGIRICQGPRKLVQSSGRIIQASEKLFWWFLTVVVGNEEIQWGILIYLRNCNIEEPICDSFSVLSLGQQE